MCCWFEHGEEILQIRNLLIVDENVRLLHVALHLFRIGHEVGREVTAVELHTFHSLEHRVATLCILDGDNTIHADSAHTIGNELTNFSIVVSRDACHLLNLLVAFAHLFSLCLNAFYHFCHSLVHTALQIERVSTSCHISHTLCQDGLRQDGSSSSAITGIVARLARNALHELCASILETVFQFDFFCHCNAIFRDARSTEFFVDHHIATFRAEGYFHCVCQSVSTFAERFARIHIVSDIFCHDKSLF